MLSKGHYCWSFQNWIFGVELGHCIVLHYLNFLFILILLLQSLVAMQQTYSGGVLGQPGLPVPKATFI